MAQRRLIIGAATAATTVAATAAASRHLESQRRPLEGCNSPAFSAALTSLRTSGVGVVDGVVDQGIVDAVKATEVFHSMPTSIERRKRQAPSRAGQRTTGRPPRGDWDTSATGRYHRREETFSENDLKVFERVEQLIWPLVVEFFQEDEEYGTQGIYRSELQVLNAVPGGTSQAWHSDNQSRGLSLIVPLVDFTAENGSTQLLLGSHNKTWPLLAQQGAQVVQAPVGAVVAYDSRTYHRGLGNETDKGRPAIIFCYDRKWSPPPGCGPYQSLVNSNLAALLNIASAGWISITRASSWK